MLPPPLVVLPPPGPLARKGCLLGLGVWGVLTT